MKKTAESKIKDFKFYSLVFLLGFIIAFLLVFSFLKCLNRFIDISLCLHYLISIVISIVLSIINIICLVVNIKRIVDSKLVYLIKKNYPYLFLIYFFLIILFATITNKVIWKANEINDVLSVEWTIFGLSITIFLVWDVLFLSYLKKKQPVKHGDMDLIQSYELINKKFSYYSEVEIEFLTIILLTINLVLLIISSVGVYIIHQPQNIFIQNLVILSFYFSTNTILSLLIDIIKPLWEERARLKKENQVTKEEMDSAQVNAIFQMVVDEVAEKIYSTEELSEEEKIKKKIKLLEGLKEMLKEDKDSQ